MRSYKLVVDGETVASLSLEPGRFAQGARALDAWVLRVFGELVGGLEGGARVAVDLGAEGAPAPAPREEALPLGLAALPEPDPAPDAGSVPPLSFSEPFEPPKKRRRPLTEEQKQVLRDRLATARAIKRAREAGGEAVSAERRSDAEPGSIPWMLGLNKPRIDVEIYIKAEQLFSRRYPKREQIANLRGPALASAQAHWHDCIANAMKLANDAEMRRLRERAVG